MELTDKAHYLLTEYNEKVRPMILEYTNYLLVLQQLEGDLMTGHFDFLSEADYILMQAEMAGLQTGITVPLKTKLREIAVQLIAKATSLVINRDDQVTDMSKNVDDNAKIDGLTAQVQALITTIQGMTAIVPGGGAGAAIATAQNAQTVVTLTQQMLDKDQQELQALQDVQGLAIAAVQVTNFANLIAQVLPED